MNSIGYINTQIFTNTFDTSIFIFPPYYVIYHLVIKNRSGYLFQHHSYYPSTLDRFLITRPN